MHKILLLLVLLFTISIFSQSSVYGRNLTKRELAIREIDRTLDKSTVLELLRKCLLEIERANKDQKTLEKSKYISHMIKIKMFLDYRWFIADTGLSKKWLSSIYKLLEYMYKTRDVIETSISNKQTGYAKYKQAVKYFDIAYKRLVNLAKKPVKVSSKVQRRSKLKKALWQKAMRKKYKIKEKVQTVEF